MISTRASVEMAGLLYDDFELGEAAEISIYPFFSQDGGVDSERTYIKQLVQKYQKMKMENLSSTMLMRTPMKRMRMEFLSFKVINYLQ